MKKIKISDVKLNRPVRMELVTTVDYGQKTGKTHQYVMKNGKRVIMVDRNRMVAAAKGVMKAG